MTKQRSLESVPDDELLRGLSELVQQSRRVESDIVAHIGEVDQRRLYASGACSSMFVYAVERLHLSEHEAYLRIAAARASRRFPKILAMLGDGRLHLTAIAKLAPHLTETNCESLLARATHKSKREIEELLAELAPKPDVPASVRKLPERPTKTPPPSQSHPEQSAQLGPDRVTFLHTPDPVPPKGPAVPVQLPPPMNPRMPAEVAPLSPARFKIQFTASAELRDKLERLKALMRSSVPDGDLAAIIEDAVTEKLEKLESRRFAKTKHPRKNLDQTDTSPSSRHIPAPVRRAVRERDGDRCTYRDEKGRRCTERRGLEFHHEKPFGLGGDHAPVTCAWPARPTTRCPRSATMARRRWRGIEETVAAYPSPRLFTTGTFMLLAASALAGRAPPA